MFDQPPSNLVTGYADQASLVYVFDSYFVALGEILVDLIHL